MSMRLAEKLRDLADDVEQLDVENSNWQRELEDTQERIADLECAYADLEDELQNAYAALDGRNNND